MPALRMITAAALLSVSVLPVLAEDAAAGNDGFLPGIYQCFAEGQYFFLRLGGDLTYEQTEPGLDPGQFEVDKASGVLRFTTGPYAIGQWTVEVHNAGDRHGVILHADRDYDCRAAR